MMNIVWTKAGGKINVDLTSFSFTSVWGHVSAEILLLVETPAASLQ